MSIPKTPGEKGGESTGKPIPLSEIMDRFFTATFTIQRKLVPILRDVVPDVLTSDQFLTLRFLREHGQVTSTELAESFGVGKSAITAIITRLAAKGLVKRLPDGKDRRVSYLKLTEEGKTLCKQAEANMTEVLGKYMDHFDEDEAEHFITTIERLARLLAQADEERGREN